MKKNLIKIITVGLSVIMLAGCGVKKDDKIIMATNAEFPPFEFVVEKGIVGEYDGIDVAIAVEIAQELGRTLEISNMEFSSVLGAVPSGKADMALAGMTADDERRQSMDFSDSYFTANQLIIVSKDNDEIVSGKDLEGKKVGVIQGYTGQKILDNHNIPSQSYPSAAGVVEDLKQGRLDAVVIDSYTADSIVYLNEGLKTVADSEMFEDEYYAIAVKKGNTELLKSINKVLNRLKDEGKIDELYQKYVQEVDLIEE